MQDEDGSRFRVIFIHTAANALKSSRFAKNPSWEIFGQKCTEGETERCFIVRSLS